MKPNISTVFSCNMSLKQLLVWPVVKVMLKNGVKYLKMTIYGAPFSTQRYQLQIYGCSRMEPIMSTASCFNMSLKQLLVCPVDKDFLKNGIKYLKIPIYGAPFKWYGYHLQIYSCRRIESNMSTVSCFVMSLKYLLVWPVWKDMLKNGVKYFKMTIYGAPFSMQRYQLQIYGCSTMTPNMSTAFSCNMNINQVLVWPVEKDMLKME